MSSGNVLFPAIIPRVSISCSATHAVLENQPMSSSRSLGRKEGASSAQLAKAADNAGPMDQLGKNVRLVAYS
jgi:hypothetical protein